MQLLFFQVETSNTAYIAPDFISAAKLGVGMGLQGLVHDHALWRFGFGIEAGGASGHTTVNGPVDENAGPYMGIKVFTGSNIYFTRQRTIGCGIYGYFVPVTNSDLLAGVQVGLSCTLPPK